MRRGGDRDRTSLRPVPRKENQGRRIRTDSIVLGTRIPTLILVKVVTMGTQELLAELSGLRSDLDQVRFPLDLPQVETARASAESIRHQLDDYVISRLETIDAPLLAVVGGSTGAGKSTLVNSLVGRPVSTPGVIRPTTISPVLVHHPDDAQWFTDRRILPGLVRTEQSTGDSTSVHLVAEPSLPRGLALLDAPDIDSVVAANRHLAAQLLQAADLWLFVTSAARYADAVPWDFLHEAAGRHAAVAVVCDRVPPAAMQEVPAHLGQLMTSRGLADSPLFAIPETVTDSAGMLPDQAIAPIRSFLAGLAADQEQRRGVVLQTLAGSIRSMCERTPQIADHLDDQALTLQRLRTDAANQFDEARRQISVQSADGTLLRGEVLARWHEFVGTGQFMRAMEEKVSWLRDRVVGAIRGTPPEADKVSVAVESGLAALVRSETDAAAERAVGAWDSSPAGRTVLEHSCDQLGRVKPDFDDRVERVIRDWQGDVMELVAGEGMSKRSRARFMALGVNGVSVTLMMLVFVHTGGLSGAEAGIAGGSAVVAQRLLEAIFGDDAVRKLADMSKDALDERVAQVVDAEAARFDDALADFDVPTQVADQLRSRVAAIIDVLTSADFDMATSTAQLGTAPDSTQSATPVARSRQEETRPELPDSRVPEDQDGRAREEER